MTFSDRTLLLPGTPVAVRLPDCLGPVPGLVLRVRPGRLRRVGRVTLAVAPGGDGPRHVDVAPQAVIATWADWVALRHRALDEHRNAAAGAWTASQPSPSCATP